MDTHCSPTYHTYGANGNTVQEQKPVYTRYYDWDSRNMMVGVRSTESGWTPNVYRYTGTGSRVSTLESIGLTYYDWDGINVIQEKDSTNTVTDRQVHGYAPIQSVGDIALMDKAAGSVYVPISDQPGTTWKMLSASAGVANAYTYDALGIGLNVSEAVSNRYRFGTKRLDADSAYYHFGRGEYAPELGRTLSLVAVAGPYPLAGQTAPIGGTPQPALGAPPGGLGSMPPSPTPASPGLGLALLALRPGDLFAKLEQIKCGLRKCWIAADYVRNEADKQHLADWMQMAWDMWRTQQALSQYASGHGGRYQWDFSHCTSSCVLTALHPNRYLDVLAAGWIEECIDMVGCLATWTRGDTVKCC